MKYTHSSSDSTKPRIKITISTDSSNLFKNKTNTFL